MSDLSLDLAEKHANFYEAASRQEADQKELSEISKRQRLLTQRIKENAAIQRASCPHPLWRRGSKTHYQRGSGGCGELYERRVPGKINTEQHASGEYEGSEHCAYCYAAFRVWKGGKVVSGPAFTAGTEAAEQRHDEEVTAHITEAKDRREQNRAAKRAKFDTNSK